MTLSNQILMTQPKIIVSLSGGVDSSTVAFLLSQQYQVECLFMKNWEEDDTQNYCMATKDKEDAKTVCDHLGIVLHTINLSYEYWENVFVDFIQQYRNGLTPNPDIFCNQEIKFKAFMHHAHRLNASKIATGHYACISEHNGQFYLKKGYDPQKDQSYFLYRLNQQQLAQSIFPLGTYYKQQIRQIATSAKLITHNKKDSTGICFIGERPFKSFLSRYIDHCMGDIIDDKGHIIGNHDGIYFYTIGQRKGLGIGGVKNYLEKPWYVAKKNIQDNTLTVVQNRQHPLLLARHIIADQWHWINDDMTISYDQCYQAKIRYRQADQNCRLKASIQNSVQIDFEVPQWAATLGQSVAIYQHDICLGGGIIREIIH